MRGIERREPFDAISMARRRPPPYGRAPIVSDDVEGSPAETVGKTDDIRTGPIKIIGGYAFRLVTEIVTTLIGNNDAETGRRKSADVVSPAVPEFWKAMEQKQQITVCRTRLGNVEVNSIGGYMRKAWNVDRIWQHVLILTGVDVLS